MTRAIVLVAVLTSITSLWADATPQQSDEKQLTPRGLPGVEITVEPGDIQPDALRKCQGLKGFSNLQKEFVFEQAQQGSINRIDESLFTMLRTGTGKTLNAAWWFNPIVDGKPRYDWDDFIALFHQVDARLSQHAWLKEWRRATEGRLLELHAFGREPEVESDMIAFKVLPIWQEAGFKGKPDYEVLARLANASWFQLFFNDEDPRVLVSYSMDPPAKPAHWLDGLDVQFHPKCEPGTPSAEYAVVEPNGHFEVREYRKCAPSTRAEGEFRFEADKLDEKQQAIVDAAPVGSKGNPIRCSLPAGERAYLDRLRCPSDKPAKYKRAGSVEEGPYGTIMDLYLVTCREWQEPVEVYMDMYHSKYVDNRPVPRFTIAASE